jgi:hypothetical protein
MYSSLPCVIIISIVDFPLLPVLRGFSRNAKQDSEVREADGGAEQRSAFDCAEYRSEFRPLEVTCHELLSDKMAMHYFEVRKLPKDLNAENELELLLSLFRAKTEEELKQMEALNVPIVTQAIGAYREITVSPEFRELERLRRETLSNEAAALAAARREERSKWEGVLADKDAAIADKDAEIAKLRALLGENKQ